MGIQERILLACRDIARQKGFYNMNMDELAQQAGMSKRTVYRYFRSKEEIIEACLDDFMQEMGEEMDRIISLDKPLPALLEDIMKHLFTRGQFITSPMGLNDLRIHYPALWQKIDAFRTEKMRRNIAVFMQRSDNKALKEIDPRIIAAVIMASIQNILNPDFILENGLTFEETARQLIKFLLLGFA